MTDDWKPIETAPTDGTSVFLFEGDEDDDVDCCIFIGCFGVPEKIEKDACGKWVDLSSGPDWENCSWFTRQPTHWMPLPKRPK